MVPMQRSTRLEVLSAESLQARFQVITLNRVQICHLIAVFANLVSANH